MLILTHINISTLQSTWSTCVKEHQKKNIKYSIRRTWSLSDSQQFLFRPLIGLIFAQLPLLIIQSMVCKSTLSDLKQKKEYFHLSHAQCSQTITLFAHRSYRSSSTILRSGQELGLCVYRIRRYHTRICINPFSTNPQLFIHMYAKSDQYVNSGVHGDGDSTVLLNYYY